MRTKSLEKGEISVCLRLGPPLSKGGRMARVIVGGCQGQVLLGGSLLSLSQVLWGDRDPLDRRATTEFECYLYVLPRATGSNRVDP